ncbi:hypothetical protein EJ06DRAFT_526620 [Trichodelitschia bisporula]|uniref:Oxidase ustYa n=1 Tax=Trichodelitschia bisporula TaxID=703511 RepID=A0A6G1I8A8_9PEZI|nr:hypothetical protein EJ06DRAFT_526620 [Trichodelitschia bisporula]
MPRPPRTRPFSLLAARLHLADATQSLILPMPPSVDLSTYEKTALMEEVPWPSISGSSTSTIAEEEEDTSPMLPTHNEKRTRRRRCSRTRSPWLFLLDAALLAVLVLVVIRQQRPTLHEAPGLMDDVTGFVPNFSTETVVFSSHPQFVSNHTSEASLREARDAWMGLLPPGQGYVAVTEDDIAKYKLPKPVVYNGGKSLGTSMMHALHCLYEIMSEYDLLALQLAPPGHSTEHMDHCIDYVRQVLLCGGDMALAGEDLPGGSSQLGVPHVCKNFDQMYSWLEGARDNDAWQFGGKEMHFVPP